MSTMLRSIFLALVATVALSTFASVPASAHGRYCSYCFHRDAYDNKIPTWLYHQQRANQYGRNRQYSGYYPRRGTRYRQRHDSNIGMAIVGGLVGGVVANMMNQQRQSQPTVVYPSSPTVRAVPTGPVYRTADGRYCREYQATATIGGQPQQTYGTACRQPDGSWQIVQ